jgi:hypothetical protein
MVIETRLRLLLANRRVAWLTNTLPAVCRPAARSAWTNDFFPAEGLRKWARVVVASPDDVGRGLALVADQGCVILLQQTSKAEPLGPLPGVFVERIANDVEHVLTIATRLAPWRRPEGTGLGRLIASDKANFIRSMTGRVKAARRRFGFTKPKGWRQFFRDLRALDEAMHGNENYYLAQIRDSHQHIDPALHYLQIGAHRGLNPTPNFSTRYYLATQPDVGRAGVNPFLHYLRMGKLEGRSAVPAAFDTAHTTSLESAQFAQLTRRSPLRDLWLSLGEGAWAEVDWRILGEAGPLSVVLISRSEVEFAAWKSTLSEYNPNQRLEVVVCVTHDCEDLPNCRIVRSGPGQDPIQTGLAEAGNSLAILCSAGVLPLAGTFMNLVFQSRAASQPVTARLLTANGLVLAASAASGAEPELRPVGSIENSAQEPAGSAVQAGPFLIAGQRDALIETAAHWTVGRPTEALVGSSALAIAKDTCGISSSSGYDHAVRAPKVQPRLWVEVDQWPGNTEQMRLAQRLLLLDLSACHGAIGLRTRAADVPLAELAWLDTFGIAWSSRAGKRPVSTSPATITITLVSSGAGEQTECIARHAIHPSALIACYSALNPAKEYAAGKAEPPLSSHRAVALCTQRTASGRLHGWISNLQSKAGASTEFLLLGPYATAERSAHWPNDYRVIRMEREFDWAFWITWGDTLLVPTASSDSDGPGILSIARQRLVSRANSARAFARLESVGWQSRWTGQ